MQRMAVLVLLWAMGAAAQNCPKVTYTTPTATTKSLVEAVNCLNGHSESPSAPAPKPAASAKGIQVDEFQIVGPQHSRNYGSVIMAVLTVNAGGSTKTAVVTPDNREATISAEAGGSCSVKLNADKTVDSHCYMAGGAVYVVYR